LLKRFYMHAGFSRYIRPGATFLRIDAADMVAAEAADASQVALVVRNDDTAAKSFTFDLTALPSVGGAVDVHRTSGTENLAQLSAIPIAGYAFTVSLPAHSVTTLVIPAH
jgi:O-glycosyl hydrolase